MQQPTTPAVGWTTERIDGGWLATCSCGHRLVRQRESTADAEVRAHRRANGCA